MLTRIFVRQEAVENSALEGLSTEGTLVYQLLISLTLEEDQRPTLEQAQVLVQNLPTGILEELRKISPSSYLGDLKARLLIAHDREDDLVPAGESRRLADAISGRGGFHHAEFSFFSHVTPNKRVGPLTFVKEAFKLFRYTYRIVRVAA